MVRDGKKYMEDNHPADKHFFAFYIENEWGMPANRMNYRWWFESIHARCSLNIWTNFICLHIYFHISLPNLACKVGLRATVAGRTLPSCSAPALQLLSAETSQTPSVHPPLASCFKLALWLSQPTVLGRPQNLQVKNRFCTCLPNTTHEEHRGGDMNATRLLNAMLEPPQHWDFQPRPECIHCLYDMETLMGISQHD